jgi:hypothetical protein
MERWMLSALARTSPGSQQQRWEDGASTSCSNGGQLLRAPLHAARQEASVQPAAAAGCSSSSCSLAGSQRRRSISPAAEAPPSCTQQQGDGCSSCSRMDSGGLACAGRPALQHQLPSVGYSELDAQHQECCGALAELQAQPSPAAFERARTVLAAHFVHEEGLMRAAGFGGQVGGGLCCQTNCRWMACTLNAICMALLAQACTAGSHSAASLVKRRCAKDDSGSGNLLDLGYLSS